MSREKDWVEFSDTVVSWAALGFQVEVSWTPGEWNELSNSGILNRRRGKPNGGFNVCYEGYGVRWRIKPNDN